MKDILKYIPGFRTNKVWKKVIAIIYYLFCLLFIFAVGIGAFLVMTSIPSILFAIIRLTKNRDKATIVTLVVAIIICGIGGQLDSSKSNDTKVKTTSEVSVVKEKTAEDIKKEADEKIKADAEAKAQAVKDKEAARLQAIEDKKAEAAAKEAEKVTYDTGITYDQLARTPDKYFAQKVKFYGKVIYVMEDRLYVQLRIAVNEDYDTILIATYHKNDFDSRVLKNDKITIRGVSTGITDYGITYQSTNQAKVMLPGVGVDMIDYN